MEFRVFISYSRKDLHLIEPVVDLLRATRDMVFHDVDTIRPGKRWRAELDEALVDTNLLVVFWCRHAAGSKYVREEYEAAMAKGKDVLPLLIDDTPLPPSLADFQFIDFRPFIGSSHTYRRWMVIGGALSAVLLAGAAGAYWAMQPATASVAVVESDDTVPAGLDTGVLIIEKSDTLLMRPDPPGGLVLPMDTAALSLDTLPMRPPPPYRPGPDGGDTAATVDTTAIAAPAGPLGPTPNGKARAPAPDEPRPVGRGFPVVLLLLAAAVLSLLAVFVARRRTPPKLRERQERIAEELRDLLERRRRMEEA
ncbi:MAG TPA: toll/interleukin-1 receptor domain-containing protein [Longimicrobium sp.]|nr:toll/interleukin-1 receptor domain-containing protein [Longimicrobium sp.]